MTLPEGPDLPKDAFGLWIVKETGELAYSRTSAAVRIDDALFAGFISAFSTFVADFANEEIQDLHFGDSILLYQRTGNVINVLGVHSKANLMEWRIRLEKMSEAFVGMFGEDLDSVYDLTVFRNFDFVLDALLLEWASQVQIEITESFVPARVDERFSELFFDDYFRKRVRDELGDTAMDVLFSIDGMRTAYAIYERLGIDVPFDRVSEALEWALAEGLILPQIFDALPQEYVPRAKHLEKVRERGTEEHLLFVRHFGERGLRAIAEINGKNNVTAIARNAGISMEETKRVLEYIQQIGWIH
ncbi:MAG: hypothetical protein ACFFCQ_05355 [Promethearchaeota archaeon]